MNEELKITKASFSTALEWLKKGKRIHRTGWSGKGIWLYLIDPVEYKLQGVGIGCEILEEASKNLSPFIGMRTEEGKFSPWDASQIDILAEDWEIV